MTHFQLNQIYQVVIHQFSLFLMIKWHLTIKAQLSQFYKMNFFAKMKGWIPRPFKFIQRQLNIEAQWLQFKSNLKPHRYKIYFIVLVVSFPFYNPYLEHYAHHLKTYLALKTHQSLQPDQPTFQIGQNLVKNLIGSLLNDQNVKAEGLTFVNKIILDDQFVGQILQLLLSALKNQNFLDNLGETSKDLIVNQLRDPQINEQLNKFIKKLASSQQTKTAFIKLIQEAFSSKQSVDTIVNLLAKGIVAPQVKDALSDTVNYSVRQLLADEQTMSQLKVFIFFLLRKFQNDEQVKGMMDVLFAKGLGLVKKPKKHPELQRILKTQKKGKINEVL